MMREDPALAGTAPIGPVRSCEELLAAAIACHGSGDQQTARRLYEDILLRQPAHPVALHHLGLIEHAAGRHDRAIA